MRPRVRPNHASVAVCSIVAVVGSTTETNKQVVGTTTSTMAYRFLRLSISIIITPSAKRMSIGYRLRLCIGLALVIPGLCRLLNSIGIFSCETVPGSNRHCEYA